MAMSRRKWNNIIIIACLMMIGTLTILDNRTKQLPEDALSLFDDNAPLTQLQMQGEWLNKGESGWQCASQVLNCAEWSKAWAELKVSALAQSPELFSSPKELMIQVATSPDGLVWQFYPEQGLLKSASGNWYEIPPSLRHDLEPIIRAGS
ncbi:hypothetical protein L2750_16780 [Shewanella submarina]|uniref:DUF2509 family protein n=1 Tax=Shewanella submarina TaxID=2016376 RepID=A0ABV7GHW4_9GAMM|nr:hypothetical protein [Shewanella submarina]MCL1038786.1 hypothetical protein [Shewanella submarina]